MTCNDYCMAVSKVRGSWRPLEGTNPFLGQIGEICEADEAKTEFTCKERTLESRCGNHQEEVHPYEKPVINVIPLINE